MGKLGERQTGPLLTVHLKDIRDMSHSINRIHFPTTIRSLAFSPTSSHPLQVMVGLDNGNIYR